MLKLLKITPCGLLLCLEYFRQFSTSVAFLAAMLNCSGNVGDWKQVVAATTHTALRDYLQRASVVLGVRLPKMSRATLAQASQA